VFFTTLSGLDNTPANCALFAKGWGRRWYGIVPGKVRCVFQNDNMSVLMKVRGRDAALGCTFLEGQLTLWTRIR
jgi:hypothetical protein